MVGRFEDALAWLRPQEGGFVDNPADAGGPTNCGITQRTYDDWRRTNSLPLQSVEYITVSEVGSIYEQRYWNPASCGRMPAPLDLVLFNIAVQRAPDDAVRTLQRALGLAGADVDGNVGPQTLGLLQQLALPPTGNPVRVAGECVADLLNHYLDRVAAHPDQHIFLRDWLRRTGSLLAHF